MYDYMFIKNVNLNSFKTIYIGLHIVINEIIM